MYLRFVEFCEKMQYLIRLEPHIGVQRDRSHLTLIMWNLHNKNMLDKNSNLVDVAEFSITEIFMIDFPADIRKSKKMI